MLVRLLYNLLLMVGVIVFAPLLFVKVILTPKHRARFLGRLWLGRQTIARAHGTPRIWVHALSVGEVASAQPLIKGLRQAYPEGCIILSTTTAAGERFAHTGLGQVGDAIVPFPFDLPWSVSRACARLRPDLFILVETDFWPNLLASLARRQVPCLLVNGRVSATSYRRYSRLAWFFAPMFRSFRQLAMQTNEDAEAMVRLGVDSCRVTGLGNLKYEAVLPAQGSLRSLTREELGLAAQALVWVAGSTHPGEEELVLTVHARLRLRHPNLFLVIAPRNIERREELVGLAARHGLQAGCRSQEKRPEAATVLLLDTLGELAALYGICDVAFVGGSLVEERGHNPLEPAAHGKPVLFGPSMEDFAEISQQLLATGGAWQVVDGEELGVRLGELLDNGALRQQMGQAALALVREGQGATARHLALIREVLTEGRDNASAA